MEKQRKKLDRKGWLKIVEAFLAILFILSAVLIIMSKQEPKTNVTESVYDKQRQILDIISKNDGLRSEILREDNTNVNKNISSLIPANWNYSTNICNISLICPNPDSINDKKVYSTEIIITSNLTTYAPKKLRFFVWMN